MSKIVLIMPYYGKFPNYFDLWLETAGYNSGFDFYIFTDENMNEYKIPNNVRVISMKLEDIKDRVERKCKFKVKLETPYKLCDYRGAYGEIFEDYLKPYDFWGVCDPDVIWGDISKYVTEDVLEKYDKIYRNGHFMLFRNNTKMNTIYKNTYHKRVISYKEAFITSWSTVFDEDMGIGYIIDEEKIPVYYQTDFDDVCIKYHRFIKYYFDGCKENDPIKINRIYKWEKGKLYSYTVKGENIDVEERMYIHLQKRIMQNKVTNIDNGFIIVPNCFIDVKDVTISDIAKYTRKKFYMHYFIGHIKYYLKRFSKEYIKYKLIVMKRNQSKEDAKFN